MRVLLLLAVVAACATHTDPVTGEPYYSPLGADYASQDKYIRENFLTERMIPNEGGLLPEPEVTAACLEIFRRVAAAVPEEHRRGFQYHFFLSASPGINAYTYGGGRIHCNLGLLARCRDAAEFAGVMAHEIGHNSHDHIGQQIGRATRSQRIFGLGGIGLPGQRIGQAIGGLVSAPVLVQHTRKAETESDDRAVDYLIRAGIDADGTARFFEAMQRDFGRGGKGPEFFRTHPFPENRVNHIRERIRTVYGGEPVGGIRTTPEFDRAVRRAREVLPYYEALHEAAAGDDVGAVLAAADKGIAALPYHAQFHFWRGVALEGQEKRDEALASLRKAVQLDRSNVLLPLVHALVELEAGNFGRAEASATQVIAILPAITGYLIRGTARHGLGKKEEAFADWDVVLDNLPARDREKLYEQLREQAPDYEYTGPR